MNLNKLLAENMVRFGTKNLSSNIMRTLLNEASKAGEKASAGPASYPLTSYSAANNTIGTYLQNFDAAKTAYGLPGGSLLPAAATALAVVVANVIATDKKYKKANPNYKTVEAIYNELGSGPTSGVEYIIQEGALATTKVTYASSVIDLYPGATAKNAGTVATIGLAQQPGGGVIYQNTQRNSAYGYLLNYLNAFNIGNVYGDGEAPDYTQYDLNTMMDENNHLNLLSTTTATNKLIVYTRGENVPSEAGKELTTTTVGASSPVSKNYDVAFTVGSSVIPANDTAVSDAVKDAIAMFPDGNITNLTVVSSASPEYNENNGGPSTLADYGQTPTTGTGDPGAGTTDIAKNIKLAYDRGVSFMTALNAGLAAAGKPQVTSYTVNWQISDNGGKNNDGRYTAVQWEKAGSKGTEVKGATPDNKKGSVTDLKATLQMKQHVFSW